jgi:hypothetical protein
MSRSITIVLVFGSLGVTAFNEAVESGKIEPASQTS